MASPSTGQRQARRAWNLLHVDAPGAQRLAERALAAATAARDPAAEGWARLVIGMHALLYGTAGDAERVLRQAERRFLAAGDRPGLILARAQIARARWRQGHFQQALAQVLPLRDEGLAVLRHEQRAVLLNTIAGCYSAYGDSAQAFAYMFEALRDAGPRRGRGFDIVLYCNLSHELMQIGDYEEALRHVAQGLERCRGLDIQRLTSVLLINRVTCLTELGRAGEALADVQALRTMPATSDGRGHIEPGFETLAIAALRAGETVLGAELLAESEADGPPRLPDDHLERATAAALLALARGRPRRAVDALLPLLGAAERRHHRRPEPAHPRPVFRRAGPGPGRPRGAAARRWRRCASGSRCIAGRPRPRRRPATRPRRCRPSCCACSIGSTRRTPSGAPPNARAAPWWRSTRSCRAACTRCRRCRRRCASRPRRTR